MKIVQIIDKLTVGGAQRLLITFAREVKVRNAELTVIALWDDPHDAIVAELVSLGARVEIFPARRSTDLGRLYKLARYFRTHRYDVICTHLFQAGLLGVILGRLTGTPVISILHNISMPDGKWRSLIWRKMLRHGSYCTVAVGAVVAEAHKDWLSGTICKVLPNPVEAIQPISEIDRINIRTRLIGDPDNLLILSVGIVSPQKAYVDLVEAVSEICRNDDRVFVAIAGGGRKHHIAVVQKKIDELELGKQVLLLGMRDDIPQLLSSADLFVSSSHWEGLPIAVLEAMSAGLPVVATSVGDVPRAVVDGTGLLVPPEEPASLRRAILQLLEDPQRRAQFGQAAQQHVAEHHDPTLWVDEQLALFAEAISNAK